jgi:hypothetical protein
MQQNLQHAPRRLPPAARFPRQPRSLGKRGTGGHHPRRHAHLRQRHSVLRQHVRAGGVCGQPIGPAHTQAMFKPQSQLLDKPTKAPQLDSHTGAGPLQALMLHKATVGKHKPTWPYAHVVAVVAAKGSSPGLFALQKLPKRKKREGGGTG